MATLHESSPGYPDIEWWSTGPPSWRNRMSRGVESSRSSESKGRKIPVQLSDSCCTGSLYRYSPRAGTSRALGYINPVNPLIDCTESRVIVGWTALRPHSQARSTRTTSMSMDWSLEQRSFLVTGGTKGIGLGVAKSLCAHGAQCVVICSRNQVECESVASNLGKEFPSTKVVGVGCDVSR